MSDKEWRLDREHMRCKCGGGELAWRLERERGVRNPPELINTHPLNTTLQLIPEGEEGEDRHELANLVLVRQGERVHETGVTGDQQTSDQDGHKVFLSKERENKTHAYLDSGASAHMFKEKEVCVEIKGKQITLTTACDKSEKKNTAQVGSTHTLVSVRHSY